MNRNAAGIRAALSTAVNRAYSCNFGALLSFAGPSVLAGSGGAYQPHQRGASRIAPASIAPLWSACDSNRRGRFAWGSPPRPETFAGHADGCPPWHARRNTGTFQTRPQHVPFQHRKASGNRKSGRLGGEPTRLEGFATSPFQAR